MYSTCSVHEEENENVVFSTLEKEGIEGEWDIARRDDTLSDWPLRGKLPSDDADALMQEQTEGLIRCERRLGTHGFFVAVFVRRSAEEPDLQAEPLQEIVQTDAAMLAVDQSAVSEVEDIEVDDAAEQPRRAKQETDFSLLRLATLDRKRRQKQELARMAQYAAQSGDACGCGHEHA